MAKPELPERQHKWPIPAIASQNVTMHNKGNIRVWSREHERDYYSPPYYRVDMFQPTMGTNGSWIPLTDANGAVVYYTTHEEAVDVGVELAEAVMENWPEAMTLPASE